MVRKLIRDMKRPGDSYTIADDVSSQRLGEFYFVFDEDRVRKGKDQALITDFDENGIPLNKTYVDVESEELVYFPISIGQLGLAVFHTYLGTSEKSDLERFLKFGRWYAENGVSDERLGIRWLTNVPLPAYRNAGPWQSAFAQSRGISILLRAYQVTGEREFAEIAGKALLSFQYQVSEGGVVSKTEWGPFFEEYTASVPVLVFNGHVFSLFGILDFHRVFPDHQLATSLVDSGINTLINCLPDFDLGYWTRYNYCRAEFYPEIDPATLGYQRLHVFLLKVLNRVKSDSTLEKYIEKWGGQIRPLNVLRSYLRKYSTLKKLNRL